MNIGQQSPDLYYFFYENLQPSYLTQDNGKVYLNDPKLGVLCFDDYGNYIRTFVLKGLKIFQVKGDSLLFVKEEKVKTYDLLRLSYSELKVPKTEGIKDVRMENQILYVLAEKAVLLYTF